MSLWLKRIICFAAFAFCLNTYAKDIKKYHDSADITIRGTVEKIHAEEEQFLLNTRFGNILVELDDYDEVAEIDWLKVGDNVVVFGNMDEAGFEEKSIDAKAVYVPVLGLYLVASDEDENLRLKNILKQGNDDSVSLNGTVMKIEDELIMLKTKYGALSVSTKEMDAKPTQSQQDQSISVGDRIYVEGRVTNDFFNRSEVVADTIVKYVFMD